MATTRTRKGGRRPRASSQDILSGNSKPSKVPAKWRRHYQLLLAAREAILRQQRGLAEDAAQERPSFSTHMADAGTDAYDRDFALGVLSSEQDAVYQIDQAIDRIRNGSFGTCELTGRPIEPARLEAIPWTRFSAAAESQLEIQGYRGRTKLGPRNTVPKGDEPEPPRRIRAERTEQV